MSTLSQSAVLAAPANGAPKWKPVFPDEIRRWHATYSTSTPPPEPSAPGSPPGAPGRKKRVVDGAAAGDGAAGESDPILFPKMPELPNGDSVYDAYARAVEAWCNRRHASILALPLGEQIDRKSSSGEGEWPTTFAAAIAAITQAPQDPIVAARAVQFLYDLLVEVLSFDAAFIGARETGVNTYNLPDGVADRFLCDLPLVGYAAETFSPILLKGGDVEMMTILLYAMCNNYVIREFPAGAAMSAEMIEIIQMGDQRIVAVPFGPAKNAEQRHEWLMAEYEPVLIKDAEHPVLREIDEAAIRALEPQVPLAPKVLAARAAAYQAEVAANSAWIAEWEERNGAKIRYHLREYTREQLAAPATDAAAATAMDEEQAFDGAPMSLADLPPLQPVAHEEPLPPEVKEGLRALRDASRAEAAQYYADWLNEMVQNTPAPPAPFVPVTGQGEGPALSLAQLAALPPLQPAADEDADEYEDAGYESDPEAEARGAGGVP